MTDSINLIERFYSWQLSSGSITHYNGKKIEIAVATETTLISPLFRLSTGNNRPILLKKTIMANESTQPKIAKKVQSNDSGSHFEWISSSQSHVGCVRTVNEDACLELIDKHLWVVADGMGGHKAGDVASRTIIESLRDVRYDSTFGTFVENVKNQIVTAHQSLVTLGSQLGQIAGSTVVAFIGRDRHGFLMWAGDSRAYLYHQGTLQQVTRDHSYVEELLARGDISPEEVASHPMANVITRAVGAGKELHLDTLNIELCYGDIILLCSDGLYKELDEGEICSAISHNHAPAKIVQNLVNACVERGARDNVTVVVVKLVEQCHLDRPV
jgi:protein phosphatase